VNGVTSTSSIINSNTASFASTTNQITSTVVKGCDESG
jgi:hypothetical protein